MSKILKRIQGFKYLLTHPRQLKWILIREVRYGQRNRSKRMWIEWQKYDAKMHISMMHAQPAALKLARESALSKARIKIFSDMFSRLGNGLDVLDAGCGDGVVGEHIVKIGNKVASLELPGIANIAQMCQASSVVAGDAEQLSFASNSFDVVLASEMIEHLWKPKSFLDEVHRILKNEGYFIVETPEGEGGLCYDSHKHYFTVERIKKMLGARFTLCEVERLKAEVGAQTPTIILLFQKSLLD